MSPSRSETGEDSGGLSLRLGPFGSLGPQDGDQGWGSTPRRVGVTRWTVRSKSTSVGETGASSVPDEIRTRPGRNNP